MTRTLLIIDDNKSVRDSLRLFLERRGYTVLVASSGIEALMLAAAHAIDAAIIDVNMPGMNGLAVCRTLRTRASEAGWNLPVWMMTGARTPELERAALESGALMVLTKPFDYADLFRRFDEQLGGPPTPPPPEPPFGG
jgi:DNA-binding response OmpR family regulator